MGKILMVQDVLLPEPTGMKPTEQDITDSKRTVNGKMRGHVVRHDVHTLECSWKVLTAEQYYTIAQAIKSKYGLSVFYHLPEQNRAAEITMYVGDRNKDTLRYDRNDKPVYKSVKMKFIEE